MPLGSLKRLRFLLSYFWNLHACNEYTGGKWKPKVILSGLLRLKVIGPNVFLKSDIYTFSVP